MRALLRDVQQQPERGPMLRSKLIADQALEAMLRDELAVLMQPCRRHDEQARHLRRTTSGLQQEPLKVRRLRRWRSIESGPEPCPLTHQVVERVTHAHAPPTIPEQ